MKKPEFNAIKYLLNNGFYSHRATVQCLSRSYITISESDAEKLTKKLCDRIINLSEESKKLENEIDQ